MAASVLSFDVLAVGRAVAMGFARRGATVAIGDFYEEAARETLDLDGSAVVHDEFEDMESSARRPVPLGPIEPPAFDCR